MDEPAFLDATAQAELVRSGQASAAELVEAAIDRIERIDPELNAVVHPLFETALAQASGSLPDGPFAGVPFLVKDLAAELEGTPMREGSRFLEGYISSADQELVTRYRRAGLVIVGKTNTPELGILPTTEPHAFGPTRNPWDVSRTPGGSSGGSAAAVAAGLVAAAHGNDGGGSIRIPASCCGVFGLKPTRGRNTLAPAYGDLYHGLVAEHVLTRSVRDSAALLDASAGPMPGDPYAAPPPARPFRDEVGADPGRLRVAVSYDSPTGAPVHEDCVTAVREAAMLCEQLGHEVVEAAPAIDGLHVGRQFARVWAAGAAWSISGWARRTGRAPAPECFEPGTWALAERGRGTSAAEYMDAWQDLQRAGRQVAAFLSEHDVWMTPTLAEPPPPLGSFEGPADEPMFGLRRAGRFAPFTPLANGTGQPAMSVPLHWSAEGLPIGTHVTAPFGDEATLLRLAAQLESARPWADRRPALAERSAPR
jgi:amidase